ncbi:ATP-binding protein [Duganella vulcania]|uniref:ATP-binding protein n=1 Tax=Duganella vulcania TaxID=2692166 RepID=A0A845GGH7_9BURK|nr:ATP-binding protein [Duganella vulcania]MYM93061.1 hypothetical protein [Duganella vulcania]
MAVPFANYHIQRRALGNLFLDKCENNIILIKGNSGSGKTSLLHSCLKEMKGLHDPITIELRENSVGVTEIFSRSATHIGWGKLEKFNHCAREMAGQVPTVKLDDIHQQGKVNSIRIALQVSDIAEREYRQTMLTEAWFDDMSALTKPLVIVFDTYEQAPAEVKNWMSGPFLSRAAKCDSVRVVIAGQTVPTAGIEWGDCHTVHELYGVREAHEWMPVVDALQKHIPVKSVEDWLAGICHALNGQPGEIMKIIKALPNKVINAIEEKS